MSSRSVVIDSVLEDLYFLKNQGSFQNTYAVDENISFFESVRKISTYTNWLFSVAGNLNSDKLLEINDLPLRNSWDKHMHARLMEMQRKEFPGLLKPITSKIFSFVNESKPDVIMDLGSGGMELERQVIEKLIAANYKKPLVVVGVDISDDVKDVARDNLSIIPGLEVMEIDNLTKSKLEELIGSNRGFRVVLAKNDIYRLEDEFANNFIDLVYNSLFMHHIPHEDKNKIRDIEINIARRVFEYDGYRNLAILFPQSIAGWNYPIFLNAAVFSNLRYPSVEDLKRLSNDWELSLHKPGFYIRSFPK